MLANDAVGALVARDAARAGVALERMRSEAHDHPALPALRTSVRGLAEWRRPGADPQAILAAVRWLDDELAPAARQVLGDAASAFVAEFFRDMAQDARGVAYEPAHAQAHRAALCLRCSEWAEAEEAATAIPGATRRADPLQWLTVARYRLHGLAATGRRSSRSPGTHRTGSRRSARSSRTNCSSASGRTSSAPANGRASRRPSSPRGFQRGSLSS